MAKRKQKLELVNSTVEEHKAFAGKHFTQHHLVSFQPKTQPQEQFMRSFFEQTPIISQIGSAGTGKTAIALYCALTEVLDRSSIYSQVIIIRSCVQARDIGFLPGALDGPDSKNEVYEMPYRALCDELLTFKSNNYDNLKAKHLLEFYNTSFLRGLNFPENSIVIVDEVQNMKYSEISTAITRTNANSKIVLCGDYRQTDLHKKGDNSGLSQLMDVLHAMPSHMYDFVEYTPDDILRSGLVKEFLIAEERQGK